MSVGATTATTATNTPTKKPTSSPTPTTSSQSGGLATGINVSASSVVLFVGEKQQLTFSVVPSDATNPTIYTDYDGYIISMDEDGLITAKNVGTTKITLKTSNNITKTVFVAVKAKPTNTPKPTATPTTTPKNVIYPPTGANIVQSAASGTLITSIEKTSTSYITRVWVKDAKNQIKKGITAGWGSYLQTLYDMANKEVANKNLSSKIMVAVNGSAWHSPSIDNDKNYNYTSVGTLAILDGNVLRNDSGNTSYKYKTLYY